VARYLGSDLGIGVEPVFELLYLDEELRHLTDEEVAENWRHVEEGKRAAIRSLARQWAEREPTDVARDLVRLERQSTWVQFPNRHASQLLGSSLADVFGSPIPWLAAFIDQGVPARFLTPLLERVASERPEGWETLVQRCFDDESLAGAATWVTVAMPEPPQRLHEAVLEQAPRYPSQIAARCRRGEIPLETLRELLSSPDSDLVYAVARSAAS
jgi:hypothetical protein